MVVAQHSVSPRAQSRDVVVTQGTGTQQCPMATLMGDSRARGGKGILPLLPAQLSHGC